MGPKRLLVRETEEQRQRMLNVHGERKPELEKIQARVFRRVDYLRSTQRERTASTSYLVVRRSCLVRHCRRHDVQALAAPRPR